MEPVINRWNHWYQGLKLLRLQFFLSATPRSVIFLKMKQAPHSRLAHVFVNLVWGIVWRKEPDKTFPSKQMKINPTYCAFILDHGVNVATVSCFYTQKQTQNSVLATPVHFQILLEVYSGFKSQVMY